MQTETDTNSVKVEGAPSGGSVLGNSSTDLVGFWGTAPVAQQQGYTALTDTSGGTAAAGTGIQALSGTYNSALIVNGISTLAAAVNNIMSALRQSGIIK